MKNNNAIGFFFVLLVGIAAGGWIVFKFKPLPEGKVIANQSSIDSLNAYILLADSIKNLPIKPNISKSDTVYFTEIRYVQTSPVPTLDIADSTITHYYDSLVVGKEINAWVDIMVKGAIEDLKIDWDYIPVVRVIETITERPVYQPIITSIKIPKYITGHYISAIAGGNANLFTFGINYTLVKSTHLYGVNYMRYGDGNVLSFQVGVNLATLFRKRN